MPSPFPTFILSFFILLGSWISFTAHPLFSLVQAVFGLIILISTIFFQKIPQKAPLFILIASTSLMIYNGYKFYISYQFYPGFLAIVLAFYFFYHLFKYLKIS